VTRAIFQCEQGGADWHAARLGIPTASRFADIITSTGKPTKNAAREAYKCQLLYERLTGQLMSNFTTPAMQRGTELEPRARAWYSLTTGRDVRQIGIAFIEQPDWKCGASPDGLCDDRGVEIKCPLGHTMIAQLLNDTAVSDYAIQMQGCMWVCGFDRWDLCLYTDSSGIPPRIYEVHADPVIQAALAEHVPAFCAELAEAEARLIAMGAGGVRSLESQGSAWPKGLE
jgi:hypothetical protein